MNENKVNPENLVAVRGLSVNFEEFTSINLRGGPITVERLK